MAKNMISTPIVLGILIPCLIYSLGMTVFAIKNYKYELRTYGNMFKVRPGWVILWAIVSLFNIVGIGLALMLLMVK